MTIEEINKIFPPSYGGNAQISDLRLLLTKINTIADFDGIQFYEVQTIPDRNALEVQQGDICKVFNVAGQTITYIYDDDAWKVLVEGTGGGGGPGTYHQITENFTVGSLDEQQQEIILQESPNLTQHLFVYLNGMYLMLGVNYDYTVSNNIIQFNGNVITQGDNLCVKYSF